MTFKDSAIHALKVKNDTDLKIRADRYEAAQQKALGEAATMATRFQELFTSPAKSQALRSNRYSDEFIPVIVVPETVDEFVTLLDDGWHPVRSGASGQFFICPDSEPLKTLADFGYEYFRE